MNIDFLYYTTPQNFVYLLDSDCFKVFSTILSRMSYLTRASNEEWFSLPNTSIAKSLIEKNKRGAIISDKQAMRKFIQVRDTLISFGLIEYQSSTNKKVSGKYKLNKENLKLYANIPIDVINDAQLSICVGDEQDGRFEGYLNVRKTFKIREKTYQVKPKNVQKFEEFEQKVEEFEEESLEELEEKLPF